MSRYHWITILFATFFACGCATYAAASTPAPIPLAVVVSQIKHELSAAQNSPSASLGLQLEKVDITFSVSRTVDVSGKVSIGVPTIDVEAGGSGGRKVEELSTLQVELAPPTSSITLSADEIGGLGLAQMIVETRKQLASGVNQSPKLEPQKVVMSIKFGVTRTGGGSATVKLVVLTIGGGAAVTTSDVNTVTLTFIKPKAP